MRSARVELAIALLLSIAIVVLASAFGTERKGQDDLRRSSFVVSRTGTRALYLVLRESGAAPSRLLRALRREDPVDRTVAVIEPSEALTRREVADAVAWTERGGRLVVVGGLAPLGAPAEHASPLLAAFGLRLEPVVRVAGSVTRIHDHEVAQRLGRIDWPAVRAVRLDPAHAPPVLLEEIVTSDADCLVGRVRRGEGELVAVADAKALENATLDEEDNAVLGVRLLTARASDAGRVVFDEFHHGFSEGDAGGGLAQALLALLTDTWPGRALLVALLAGMVYVSGAAVRLGAPERERPPPRRALSEHAEALGRIFEAARARTETLRILAAGARRRTAARAGLPATLAGAEFARRLRLSTSPGAAELADAMERADAGRAPKDVEMARVAANLAAALRRFLHG